MSDDAALRRTVGRVAALNFAYFFVEAGVALAIGSVALFADSIDFLEDTSVNLLILLALGWTAVARARAGMAMAVLLLVPAAGALWTAYEKLFVHAAVPDPVPLALTGLGALAVNSLCALMLARHRASGGSLSRAAFLSARNDAVANIAIIAAGIVTALTASVWPDVVVGLAIAAINADAAFEVWEAARAEEKAAVS